MFLIISKLSSLILDPAGLTLFVLAAGVILLFLRKIKTACVVLICGFSILLIFSTPLVPHILIRGLEGRYPPSPYYGRASAVVLLGGGTTGKVPPRTYVELNHVSGNRIPHAARVFKQSGSPTLILSGGLIEMMSEETVPEAFSMFELLNELFGIDTADVLLESRSKNTRENAIFTKTLMEEAGLGNDIILVTSAFHMPRTVGIFKKAGFEVTPAPTGYMKNSFISGKPLTWMPSSGHLYESTIAIREYIGIMAYKMMGWI